MSQPVPRDLVRRIAQQRDQTRALADLLAAHIRDLRASGRDFEQIATMDLVRGRIEAALVEFEHALREARAGQ